MTTFLFIRHGESEANAGGRISTAPPGPRLSADGRQQARELADRLVDIQLSAVYSSPMLRATETGRQIAASTGVPHIVHPDLVELFVGEVEGMAAEEGLRRLDVGWRRWIDHGAYELPVAPGGETARAAIERLRHFLASAHERFPGGGRIAVVAHGGILNLVCALCVNLPFDHGYRNWLRNAEVAEATYHEGELVCSLWRGLPADPPARQGRPAARGPLAELPS
jgi:broad specificity phosphatase PhoE